MARGTTQSEAALELAAKHGVLRLRDAQERGIHHEVLRRLVTEGKLIKVARGMYTLAEESTPTDLDLSLAAARVPNGVVCLISALFHYGIGTQMPHEVWMMIDRRAHRPKVDYPPMRFVLGSGASLKEGVETVVIDERGFPTPMRVADPRFWAAHKLWLAEREDRDPQKKIRDRQQALVLLELIASRLPQLRLDEDFKRMLPGALRPLFEAALKRGGNSAQSSPDW